MSFERRCKDEPTTMYLGRVLEDYLYLPEMARRARQGHFDDFFCPPEVDDGMNLSRLVHELTGWSETFPSHSPRLQRVKEVIELIKTGEFNGTREESDHWAASKDGQETFREILGEINNASKESKTTQMGLRGERTEVGQETPLQQQGQASQEK